MDPLKDFLKKNHTEPCDSPSDLAARSWSKIEQEKPHRQSWYLGLSLATASLAMIIGVGLNLRSGELFKTENSLAGFEDEAFVVDSFSNFEENIDESSEDFALVFDSAL